MLAMLGIFPRWHPVDMDLLRNLFESRYLAHGIQTGIQPLLGHPAIFQRPVAGLVDRDDIGTAQSKSVLSGAPFLFFWPLTTTRTIQRRAPERSTTRYKILDQLLG
ncbi:MAG: hypothetical protein WBB25_02075 [Sulfitobacter sp.]